MRKLWINNNLIDRIAMLQQTELKLGRINQVAIEKDWWVTITLKALFQTDCAKHLLFKGGTSLSKGFNIIERFSEDIDLSISQSFFGIEKTNRSQREKLRKTARSYIQENLSKQLDKQLKEMDVTGYSIENVTQVQNKTGEVKQIDSDKDPTVIILHYQSIISKNINYILPRVKIEISCLSMDEPFEEREIRSFIGQLFTQEDSDCTCKIRTVVPQRTFLEKLFLLSEEFQKERPRSIRMSRHLYDIEKLMDTQYGIQALQNRDLYNSIVEHRRTFYDLKYVNYDLHKPSAINFTIPPKELAVWREDYHNMQRFFIYGQSIDFDSLTKRIEELQERVRNLADK